MTLEANRAASAHLLEEALENYALGRLLHDQLATVEEHLLICERCRERLNAEDDLIEAMHLSAEMEDLDRWPAYRPPRPAAPASRPARLPIARWLGTGFRGAPAWGAALAAVLVIGTAVWTLRTRTGSTFPEPVTLTTLRGGEGTAEAHAGRPLEISIDASTLSGSESGPYRLEVVDAAGTTVWIGTATPDSSGRLTTHMESRLGTGMYWVRLSPPSGKLLREFGLHVQ